MRLARWNGFTSWSMPRVKPRKRVLDNRPPGIGQVPEWRPGKSPHLARDDRVVAKAVRHDLRPAGGEDRPNAGRKLLQPTTPAASGRNCSRERHCPGKQGAIAVFFEDDPHFKEQPRARWQKRRRVQARQDRPGRPGLPAGNVGNRTKSSTSPMAASNCTSSRCSPFSEMAGAPSTGSARCKFSKSRRAGARRSETGPRLVWFDPGRGRQAVQDAGAARR